jgi:Kef-type K+ transport system membrane component KefB
MNVTLGDLGPQIGLVLAFFVVKLAAKSFGVFPLARLHMPGAATYTTLLMSTGLTFGTISSLYGLQAGYIDHVQFSVLLTVVIGTAVVPTVIAQRWFAPRLSAEEQEEALAREEESA